MAVTILLVATAGISGTIIAIARAVSTRAPYDRWAFQLAFMHIAVALGPLVLGLLWRDAKMSVSIRNGVRLVAFFGMAASIVVAVGLTLRGIVTLLIAAMGVAYVAAVLVVPFLLGQLLFVIVRWRRGSGT